jgi:hypothetical protein
MPLPFPTDDPAFLFLVGVLLLVVFFGYLFARRIALSLREGFDEGYR